MISFHKNLNEYHDLHLNCTSLSGGKIYHESMLASSHASPITLRKYARLMLVDIRLINVCSLIMACIGTDNGLI